MATVKLNPTFIEMKGNIGRLIYYKRMGKVCVRSHIIPRNPKTEAQQLNRGIFAAAIKSWQLLSPEEKSSWKAKGRKKGHTGYNYYVSEYMRHSGRRELHPVIMGISSYTASMRFHTPSVSSPLRQASRLYDTCFMEELTGS